MSNQNIHFMIILPTLKKGEILDLTACYYYVYMMRFFYNKRGYTVIMQL